MANISEQTNQEKAPVEPIEQIDNRLEYRMMEMFVPRSSLIDDSKPQRVLWGRWI